MKSFLYPVFSILLLALSLNGHGQSGQIDFSFAQNGWFYLPTDEIITINNMVAQPDGRILVQANSRLMRLMPNGLFDNSFNFTGIVEDVTAFSLTAEGEIYILREDEINWGNGWLIRLNANGTIDNSFGANGSKQILNQTISIGFNSQLFVKPNGKMIMSSVDPSSNYATRITQYTADGNIDNGFGSGGVIVPFPSVEASGGESEDFAILDDNSIIFLTGCPTGPCLVKVLDNGQLDPSFGTNGAAGVSPQFEGAEAIAVQKDGKVIVGGDWKPSSGPTRDFMLMRHHTDGTFDASFGNNGTVLTDLGNLSDIVYDLLVQPDGKIVAAGQANGASGFFDFGIAKYLPNGQLDASFSFDGKDTQIVPEEGGAIDQVVLLPSGELVVAGAYSPFSGFDYTIVISKYLNDVDFSSTSIQEGHSSEYQIFPNPVQDQIYIKGLESSEPVSWQLRDLTGKTVHSGQVQKDGYLGNMGSLSAGLYLLELENGFKQKIQLD